MQEHAQQFMPEFIRLYEEEIKPRLESGEYAVIHDSLEAAQQYIHQFAGSVTLASGGAINLVGNILRLYEETAQGHRPSDHILKNLETFVRQYKLREDSLQTA